jgi:hypothetical protein
MRRVLGRSSKRKNDFMMALRANEKKGHFTRSRGSGWNGGNPCCPFSYGTKLKKCEGTADGLNPTWKTSIEVECLN